LEPAVTTRDGPRLWIEVVTDTYVPDVNGVSFSLGRLCSGLRALGHRVEVIRSGRVDAEGETSVLSWPLPGYWEIKVGAPLPGQLFRRWRKNRPDLVYIAIETPMGFSAAKAARRLGIPVVGGFHTNFSEYLKNYGAPRIGQWIWSYQKWFHEGLDRTLVPSPDAKCKLDAAGFSKVSVLGRGVDTDLFSPARRCESFRREFGVADGVPLAIVVGRVSNEKNIGLAIRAFTRMRESCPEMVCMVIGDGPARARLEREHPEVRFPGYLLGERLATCYASADLMLFPSETETFGNVLTEGMAGGLAILAYDYAAAGWHGKDGVNLRKVPKGDESAFLAASLDLLDPGMRSRLGAAARETSLSLGWSGVVARLEELFHAVISAKGH
jgi:glycosyltransferase involved in cell wall biosynthesis